MNRVQTVGLTGGLASGKSTVAGLLADRGAEVRDADRVVAELYEPSGRGAAAVAELFGDTMLDAEGRVDRTRLGDLVFADPRALARLNRAVHPLVAEEIAVWIDGLDDGAVAVVEATLMIETGTHGIYDVVVVVWCGAEQQLRRAVARGVPRARAEDTLAAQLPLDEKAAIADFVIDNSRDRSNLVEEVDRVWAAIAERR